MWCGLPRWILLLNLFACVQFPQAFQENKIQEKENKALFFSQQ
jgi:hypothetical protein